MTKIMKVITHFGVFHADEVAAIAALSLLFPNLQVVRTRDPLQINEGDLVVDVGGIYDPELNRFDHHQKGGAGERQNGVPYAAFGLVWKKYGEQICKAVLGTFYQINFSEVADLVEENLVMGIDARDNGVKTHLGLNNASPYTISDAISAFNPNWYSDQNFEAGFFQAVEMFKLVLINEIRSKTGNVLAEFQVSEYLVEQPGQKILIFDRYLPWSNIVPVKAPEALYVVFPDVSGSWRVQAVPKGTGKESFELKAPLPLNWRGASLKDLQALTGVEDVIFCHNGGFIMGTKTQEAALHCAELALALYERAESLR
jgi:uncharacterized UPF0160 family protein